VTPTTATNPYVGTAKSLPASFAPRRFAIVMRTTKEDANATRCSASPGAADVTAMAPAVTLTDTVKT
jgi:hypothetical protein